MNYSNIKYYDIANGDGVRTTLFVSGCRNHCEGCFQPETWDFNYSENQRIINMDKFRKTGKIVEI